MSDAAISCADGEPGNSRFRWWAIPIPPFCGNSATFTLSGHHDVDPIEELAA